MEQPSTQIEFYKQRDLGEKISDTFDFLKHNFKELFMLLLKTVLPISAIIIIIPVFFPEYYIQNWSNIRYYNEMAPLVMLIYYAGSVIAAIYTYSAVLTLLYKKSFIDNPDQTTSFNLSKEITSNMGQIFIAGLLAGLIIIGCFFLLIIPGIIVGVMLCFVATIVVFEKTNGATAISRSWNLGINKWWHTFGLIIILALITYIINIILAIPAIATIFIVGITDFRINEAGFLLKSLYFITLLISKFGSSLVSMISIVAIAFQYANIREIKEGITIQKQITDFDQQ